MFFFQIVPWLDGESVKLCPSCVKRFYLTRRQHHCRLCGTIMCHDCSRVLSFSDACKLDSDRIPAVRTLNAITICSEHYSTIVFAYRRWSTNITINQQQEGRWTSRVRSLFALGVKSQRNARQSNA